LKRILIVEDEVAIREFEAINLKRVGYDIEEAGSGEEALDIYDNDAEGFDIALLDISMPGMDGFTLCKELRKRSETLGIIMLTARTQEMDKISGLMLGADDYITKPFSVREVLARVKANMRRFAGDTKEEAQDIIVAAPDFIINTTKYEAIKNGVTLDLTLREYELLKFLVVQPNRIFSREALLSSVWGYEFYGDVRTVDVTVRRLREKVEDDSSNPKYILTKRGVGYYFSKSAE